jgi:hypothetical protein
MIWAKIENNVVTNIINAEASFVSTLDGNYIKISEDQIIGRGYIYNADANVFYTSTGPNGYIFDSETFQWVQPPNPGDSESHYWSFRAGAWVVDNRPPKPTVRPGSTDYWIWNESTISSDLDEWQIDTYNAIIYRSAVDNRKQKRETFFAETKDLYIDLLLEKYSTDSESNTLTELYNAIQKIEVYTDDRLYYDSEVVFEYNGTTWRI